MTVALRIGGHWHSPRTHTPPVYETKVDGGMGDASFSLLLPSDAVPLGVERDALVEMIEDSQRVYLGRINGIDPAAWGIKCRGIGTDLDEVPALSSPSGSLTRDIAVAIATAKAAPFGVTINNSRGVSGVAMGDSSEPVMVGHLLELLAEQETARWGVDADWQLYMRVDPTEPQWIIHAPDLGLTDEGGAPYNMYAGRYVDYTTGLYATAYSATPTGKIKCANVDLTKRGQMSPLNASIILNNLAKATRDTPTWGSTITVTPSQIRTMGMQPADPSSVLGGHMARMIGLSASQQAVAGGEYLDVVLSSVVRDTGTDALTIAPVGSLPTTIEEALAAIA